MLDNITNSIDEIDFNNVSGHVNEKNVLRKLENKSKLLLKNNTKNTEKENSQKLLFERDNKKEKTKDNNQNPHVSNTKKDEFFTFKKPDYKYKDTQTLQDDESNETEQNNLFGHISKHKDMTLKQDNLIFVQCIICAIIIAISFAVKTFSTEFYLQIKTALETSLTQGIEFSQETPILRFASTSVQDIQSFAQDISEIASNAMFIQEAKNEQSDSNEQEKISESVLNEIEINEQNIAQSSSILHPLLNDSQSGITNETQVSEQAQESNGDLNGMGGKTDDEIFDIIPNDVSLSEYSGVVDLQQPVSGVLTSEFGFRVNPISYKWEFHKGIDIAAPEGTGVYCVADGHIVEVDYNNIRGNYIIVHHTSGLQTLYQHLDFTFVRVGQSVIAGEKIATVGNTGYSTGPHLHFELIENTMCVDPLTQFEYS